MGQPNSAEAFIQAVIDCGMVISHIRVGTYPELKLSWQPFDHTAENDYDPIYEHRQFAFHFHEPREAPLNIGINGHLNVQWPPKSTSRSKTSSNFLKLSTDSTAMFTQSKYQSEDNCNRLLHLAQWLYQVYRPQFGFIERGLLSGYTTKTHLEQLEIPHIYWANFFGPEYVAKYGVHFFQKAPGWFIQPLDDGGILYVLSPDTRRNYKGAKKQERLIREYFQVPEIRKKVKIKSKSPKGRHPNQPEPLNLPETAAWKAHKAAGTLTEKVAADLLLRALWRAKKAGEEE